MRLFSKPMTRLRTTAAMKLIKPKQIKKHQDF